MERTARARETAAATAPACPLCGVCDALVAHQGEFVVAGEPVRQDTRVCRGCGLTFEHAEPDLDWPSLYGTVWKRGPEQASHHAALYAEDARLLGDGGGRRVFDVGCGAGFLLDKLRERGWRTAGCEPEAAVAERAREKGHDVATALLAPRPEFRADCFVLGDVLEHAAEPRALLATVRGLLAPDGLLYLRVPELAREKLGCESFGDVFGLQHRVWLTEGTLRALLGVAGFAPEWIVPHAGGLRALARPTSTGVRTQPVLPAGEPEASAALIRDYSRGLRERRARIAQRLARLAGRRVALFGAGEHAAELLAYTPLGRIAARVADSNPARWGESCAGLAVEPPAALRSDPPEAIVVASKAYQDEIAAGLADLAQRGVEIVQLYERGGRR